MSNILKVFGPPGTGKTTYLLNVVMEELNRDVNPADICFIAFTRKASHEARERAVEKFGLEEESFPWFRTLHSFAYRRLGIRSGQVMSFRDYLVIAKELGISITFKAIDEDGTFVGYSKGDRLLFTENMARMTRRPLEEYWNEHGEMLELAEVKLVRDTLIEYKKAYSKLDFTDMIELWIKSDDEPQFVSLIVDEAQDLSKIQWDMIKKLARNAERVTIAGDDDQAIFKWAGADVDSFISYPGNQTVLPQSYRVPRLIQHLANDIITNISNRVCKIWKSRNAPGEVNHIVKLEECDLETGSWLLLARNSFLIESLNDYCTERGYVFSSTVGHPIDLALVNVIRSWEKLRRGESLPIEAVVAVYDLMSANVGVRHGYKNKIMDVKGEVTLKDLELKHGLMTREPWNKALDRLEPREVQYFTNAAQRKEKFTKEPRIKISTIHGAKGGEAENVLLLTDMAPRTWNEYQKNPDDEHRVWFVAVTRAKEKLYIMNPMTNKHYDL